jgi:hypothetical protein
MIAYQSFRTRIFGAAMSVVFFASMTPTASAGLEVLAITGDAMPGGAGELLQGVTPGVINNAGLVVFRSTLQEGVAGVSSSDNDALWSIDESTNAILAREGSSAPGGGAFAAFQRVVVDNSGSVALRATLQTGPLGVWRLSSPSSGSVVARTQDFQVPGVASGARYQSIDSRLQSSGDHIAFSATMTVGLGGVGTTNRRGAWLSDGSSTVLLARADVTAPPGVPAGKIENLTVTAVNDAGQAAALGTMTTPWGGVTTSTKAAVWRLAAGDNTLVARQGVGNVPGVASGSFQAFVDPVVNSSGQIAFEASLVSGARGVWRYDGSSGELIAQTGVGVAPGTAGAQFADVTFPLLNNAGQTLFRGTLDVGVGDATAGNNLGLWLADPDESSLLARIGSGGVPGVTGANFSTFVATALNAQGLAAVSAELEIGPGGVSSGNENGIWLLDALGGSQLVARTGETLAGRTIASLELMGDSGGGDGRARSLNDAGQLVFKAAFTDGAEATVLYSPSSSFESPANFDGDADVDGDDLSLWTSNFGAGPGATNGQGDADMDGYVDGADFLIWQREVTGAPAAESEQVPEPAGCLLAIIAGAAAVVRRRRAHCPAAPAALPWK